MVKDREVDRLAGADQSPRCAAIGPAWTWVAAWVIVREDQASAAQSGRVHNDVPDGKVDRFRLAVIALDVEAAGGSVDMGDPQPFPWITPGAKACRKESSRDFMAVQDRRQLIALKPHPALLCPVRFWPYVKLVHSGPDFPWQAWLDVARR